MADLTIQIDISRRKKKPESSESPEVWPTMIQSDDPFLGPTSFEFFDALTTPLDVPITSIFSSAAIKIEGNFLDLAVVGGRTRVSWQEFDSELGENVTKYADVVIDFVAYPFLSDLTHTLIEFSSDHGIPDEAIDPTVRLWKDCDGCSGELVKVYTDYQDFSGYLNLAINGYHVTDDTIECWTNESSLLPSATIASEFDPDDFAKLIDRKPLKQYDAAFSAGLRRWIIGAGFFDILLQLKKDSEDTAERRSCSASMILDEETAFKTSPTTQGLSYKKSSILGKFHIAVSELGSATQASYLYPYELPLSETEIQYRKLQLNEILVGTINGIEQPANLFFSPFDTSDTTNFKVTLEPDFNADPITTPIIQGGNKIRVLLMSRRWAYESHSKERWTTSGLLTFSSETTDAFTTIACSILGNGNSLYTVTVDSPNTAACYDRAAALKFVPTSPLGGGSVSSTIENFGSASMGNCEGLGVTFGSTQTINWSINERFCVHKVGLWWDRFPNNYLAKSPSTLLDGKSTIAYIGAQPPLGTTDYLHTVGDCGKTFLLTYYDDIRNGINGLRLFSIKSLVGANPYATTAYQVTSADDVGRDISCYPHISQQSPYSYENNNAHVWYKIAGVSNDPVPDGVGIPTVRSSAFWTAHNLPSFDPTRILSKWVNHPHGVGISPDRTGALVGIVVVGRKPYYVWRATDEEFTVESLPLNDIPALHDSEVYPGHRQSFESKQQDGRPFGWIDPLAIIDGYSVGGLDGLSGGIELSSYSEQADAGFIDQFTNEDGDTATLTGLRKITHMGRPRKVLIKLSETEYSTEYYWEYSGSGNFVGGSETTETGTCSDSSLANVYITGDTPGQYQLDAPVYVMGSFEGHISYEHSGNYYQYYSSDYTVPASRYLRSGG